MNFKQLVIRNILRNTREYATYFLSSLTSVAIFFIFSMLFYHPSLTEELKGSSSTVGRFANIGMVAAEITVVVMSFIFLWYAFSLFFHKRKPQLSIYLTLGMTREKLKKMLFLENILIGFSSIVFGISIGTLLSKLVLLIAQNIIGLNKSLNFYFPTKAIALTIIVYGILFILLSLFTMFRLSNQSLISLKTSNLKNEKPPKASSLLALVSLVLIGIGYALAQVAALSMKKNFSTGAILMFLFLCVFITVLGTYLFFQQASVKVFQQLKKKNIFIKKGNLLILSNLMFRMKSNATMYFLISIIASIGFVGIGVSKSISSDRFATTQGDSFSYVYSIPSSLNPSDNSKKETLNDHKDNVDFIQRTLENSGFKPIVKEIDYKDITLYQDGQPAGNYTLIPLSIYNDLAKSIGKKEQIIPANEHAIQLARTQTEVSIANYIEPLQGTIEKTDLNLTIYRSDVQMYIGFLSALTIVRDDLFKLLTTSNEQETPPITVMYFPDWIKSSKPHQIIKSHLDNQLNDVKKEETELVKLMGNSDYSRDFTEAENNKLLQIREKEFYYSSLYDTWYAAKQSNGMIIIISILLGTVFFIFSSSIIYFKLFGELEVDSKYHRSLHIIGVSKKQRHKIITTEIVIMFFAPFIISSAHFFAAMTAMKLLIDLPVYSYTIIILSVYLIFQIVFFLVSRYKYIRAIDRYALNRI